MSSLGFPALLRWSVFALLPLFSVGAQAQVNYASAWTQQEASAVPPTVPSPRIDAAMASDTAGNVVLFGGQGALGVFADTWVWNGSTWKLQSPAHSPSARYEAGAAYDAAHGVVVLFGGFDNNGNEFNDTWTWDGTDWTQQDVSAAAAALPSPRVYPGMAYDAAGHIVLFGGFDETHSAFFTDTWIWNGSSWSQPNLAGNTPLGRYAAVMAYDAASGQTVLFGGSNFNGQLGDTWTWNGTAWRQQSPAPAPASREQASMAYDANAGELVLFGGVSSYNEVNDTWTWNGSAWTQQSPPASPPTRYGAGMAYASSARQMVLFGGAERSYTGDTWTYQPGPYNFGNVNVCTTGQTTPAPCSAQTTLAFNIGTTVTVGSVKVVTQGAAGLDFTRVSDTCVGPQTAPATCTVTAQFAPLAPGVRTGAVEIFDDSGNLLATEPLSGIGQAPAVVFPSAATQTVLASLSPEQPRNLTVDAAGNVFVAECCSSDSSANQVLEIKGDGSGTTTITTQVPNLGGLFGVAEDGAGDLYAASPNTYLIYQIPAGCQSVSCYVQAGFAGEANQIALDAAGDLFAVDGLGRAYKYPPTCFGSANLANCGAILGSGFKYPQGVAVDAAGNVYVADPANGASKVVKIPADGSAQSTVGVGLTAPSAVAVDAAGDVFIADQTLSYIVEVPAGCTSADCQLQIGSGFSVPIGVAVDAVGNVYVSDQKTDQVTKITMSTPPALTFPSTQAGSSSSAQSFQIQNIGNQALSGTLAVGTGFAQVAGGGTPADCTASLALAPSAECNVSIDFSPTTATLYSGAAVFTDNTPSGAQSVALSGTGTATTVNVTFGTQPVPLSYSVDGISYTSTQTLTLPVGKTVNLYAIAPQYVGGVEYGFQGWSLNGNSLTVSPTTTSDVAQFAAFGYQLTVTAGTGGTVTGSAANGYYPAYLTQKLVATPNAGYYFTGWTGGSNIVNRSSASTSVGMLSPESITATFAAIPTYTVTNLSDSADPGSLRAAITSADANNGGAGIITFTPSLTGTITLLTALPALNGAITITGPGANALSVSGNNSAAVGGILVVNSGATVSLSGLTLANSVGSGGYGGAIGNSGTLTIANCILSGNSSSGGVGGAIYSVGTLTVRNSTFTGNTAKNAGGAIYANSLVVTGSTFYHNSTPRGQGGAIIAPASATVSNSTFVDNVADEGGAFFGNGTITNNIFSGNQAASGGAVAAFELINANDNFYGSTDDCASCTSNTNPVSGNANLAPLGNYGGPTTTMLPLPGSAAICAGSATGATTDQRGFPISTTYGSTVCNDLGAVQTSYGLSFTSEPPATGTAPGTAMSPVAVTVKESGNLLTGGSTSLNLTDANTDLTTTPATGSTTLGVATFSSLIFTSPTTGDTLTATLPLNPALTTPLSITTPSTSFSVSPSTVAVSIGTSPAGLSFSINGAASTSTQTPTFTIGTPVTLATTSPQYAGGTQFTFVGWSDGATTITDTLIPSAATTNDTANFSATGYQLTVTAGAGGTITGTAANGYYTAASQQSLVATPNAGYYFTGWTGSSDIASASSASTSVTMNAPESITAGFAQIPSYTVTNLNDDASAGSLRAAITSADANNGGAGTITFTPSLTGTITLLSALPSLNGAISISGPGANALTVSGNNSTTVGSIFAVSGGATATISGLTLANGSVASGLVLDGGAIHNSGTLTVTNCTLSGNSDANGTGGAIYNNGKLTVANSILSNNVARGYKQGGVGGAIDSVFGTVSVTGSTFSGNQTGTFGGAIAAGSVVVTGSTFYNNSASTGGAISVNASATVSDSTFVNNTAVEGGAINGGGTVSNSIFSGNQAGYGAAIDASGFTLNANFNLYDSNVDNQSGNTLADICNSCTSNTNPVSGSANLAPLGNYGGPTTTMLPLPGSAAICAGSAALVPVGDMFDQRGFPISTTYGIRACSDLGAVQTSYALGFSTEPPATGTLTGTAMSPVAVTVEECALPFTGGSAPVSVTDANADLTTTPATASTTAGVATFSNLIFKAVITGDTLTATLSLNPALATPLSISTPSTSFSIGASTVNVAIGTSPAGLNFSINGATYTTTQTPALSVGTAYTLATTSPQYAGGTQFSFLGWSDGITTTTDTLTPTATTTSDVADFSATAYQLTVTAGAGGTVTASAATGYYPTASHQPLMATPNAGYYFTGWTGSSDIASASSASTSVTMTAPESITATFSAIPSYQVTTLGGDAAGGNASNCPGPACKLRDAMLAADANNGGAGTITFAPGLTGTITLNSALPSLSGAITISGPGASVVTVSGNNAANVATIFVVNSGATAGISGLTIANGLGIGGGGGIHNSGTLTVSRCALSGNQDDNGGPGGIDNDHGAMLTVSGSTFSGNSGSLGGGIGVGTNSTVLVSNSTFNQNVAGIGGGISNQGTLTVNGSTLSGNQSEYGSGGIENNSNPALTLHNDIIAGNMTGGVLTDDCDGCGTQSSANLIGGTPLLAPLGSYGGPTQTMLPLPGSPAICVGSAALIPAGTTTDQRGFPDSTKYGSTVCTDLGAVQTSYGLSFTIEPAATGSVPGTAMSPVPAVTVKESGALLTGGPASLSVSDAKADLTTTPAKGSTSSGVATFSSLIFTAATTGDTLTATLSLNPAFTTPLSIATQSTAFSVSTVTPALSFVPLPNTQTYGTPIAAGSLDATATASNVTVPGTFTYTATINGVANQPVTAGVTILPAGPYTLKATFTPANPNADAAGSTTAAYTVTQATPTLTLPTASAIAYGQMLSSSTLTGGSALSGTTPVAGTFTFTAPTTVPAAGTQSESITFTPANPTNYAAVIASVSVSVSKATPTLTLPTASAIVYGQTLASSKLTGGSALSGTTPVAGTFTFTAPTTAPAPGAPSESVTFTPANTANYATVTGNVSVIVNKATPILTLPTASAIIYGQTLGSSKLTGGSALSGTTAVAGTFTFTAPTTIPAAGTPSESVTFTPANTADYATVTGNISVTVNKATPILTLPTASAIAYGQTLSSSKLTGGSAVAGTTTVAGVFTFTTPASLPAVGTPSESVTFTPANSTDYATVSGNVSVTVNKATPAIIWTTPAPITYGTALSATQLDATASANSASVAGSFSYTPASGILAAGTDKLAVTFTPANPADYTAASASVMLTVNKASTTITVASSMNPSGYGQPVTFTATIHSSAMGETGSVSWLPALCAPTPVITGIAKCTVSTLPVGNDSISASYSGDMNFSNSQGALPGSQSVEDPLKFSASTINFSNVYLYTTVTQTLTLTNTGPTAVAISSVTIPLPKASGSDAQEFVAHNLCPTSLAAGKNCTVIISFSASVEDYSPSASLVITDSAFGSPQTIPLLATVIKPRLAEEPNSLNFAPQKVGTTSAAQTVALVNHSATPLDFSALTVTANFGFAAGTTCTSTTTLAPGKSCTLNVVFQPSSTGAKAGRIFITSDDYYPVQAIFLSGAGD